MPTAEWRARNPEKVREAARRARALWRARNQTLIQSDEFRATVARRTREWYVKNRDRALARKAAKYRNDPNEKMRRQAGALKRLYGITIEQKEILLKSQDEKCAICRGSPHKSVNSWHVDHCHETGKIRGILCNLCNLMLSKARDNPDILAAAAQYLRNR